MLQPPMSSVMKSCDKRSDFSSFVGCSGNNYSSLKIQIVRSFCAQLSSIKKDYENGGLSNSKARAAP